MAARTGDAGGAPFLLEAHYYSGGLRIKPLGTGIRPGWVPAPPGTYVGFRDEFVLGHDDAVLEFARFAVAGERLTWIGIFHRSVDSVFGDRDNHAGAGIWLRGQRVLDLRGLLHGLHVIASGVAREGVDAVANDADNFAGNFLPGYVAPATPLPAQLDGWRYSPTQFPDTAIFVADAASEDEAWRLAGEQVARMSLLPHQGDAVSRALIRVRVSAGDRVREPGKGFEAIRGGLPMDLIGALPEAIADIAAQNRTMAEELRMARGLGAKAEAELGELRAASAAAKARVAELEQQLSESDLLRRLTAIDGRLEAIEEGGREERALLDSVDREIRRLKMPVPSLPLSRSGGERMEAVLPPVPPPPVAGGSRWRTAWRVIRKYAFATLLVTLIVALLVLVFFDPFGWLQPPK